MDNLLDKVKRLLGGGQQPKFLSDIGNAVKQGYQSYSNTYQKVSPYIPFAPQYSTPQQIQQNKQGIKTAVSEFVTGFNQAPASQPYQYEQHPMRTLGQFLGAGSPGFNSALNTGKGIVSMVPKAINFARDWKFIGGVNEQNQQNTEKYIQNTPIYKKNPALADAYRTSMNYLVGGITMGGRPSGNSFTKEQIETVRKGFSPEVRNLVGKFAQIVEDNPNANRKNLGELGEYIQSLGEAVFGKEASNLTNKQLKNALDLIMQQADRGPGLGEFTYGLATKNAREEGKNNLEEFVKAHGTQKIEVRDKSGLKLQDPYTAEYLPTNSDGTITLYHSTTKESAEKIKQSGIFGSKTEGGDIYFTTNKKGYGGIGKDKDVVLAFNVDPKKVKFDDIYRGELHLKGNNTDIGGIKPVQIKTKSQLTDIWNKAQPTIKIKGEEGKGIEAKALDYYNANKENLVNEYIKRNGNVVNPDMAKDLFKPIGYNYTNAKEVHEPSSQLAKKVYTQLLETRKGTGNNEILFTAGGSGVGKTSAIKEILDGEINDFSIIYDSNLSNYESAVKKINQALQKGYKPSIVYVYRDPLKAWGEGVMVRSARGERHVPLDVHIQLHNSSKETIKKLNEKFGSDINITIIDNSGPKRQAKIVPIDFLNNISYNKGEIRRQLYEITNQAITEGKISTEQVPEYQELQKIYGKNLPRSPEQNQVKQLTDIWNKAQSTKGVDPLIQEARKYKSAEELPDTYFHATNKPDEVLKSGYIKSGWGRGNFSKGDVFVKPPKGKDLQVVFGTTRENVASEGRVGFGGFKITSNMNDLPLNKTRVFLRNSKGELLDVTEAYKSGATTKSQLIDKWNKSQSTGGVLKIKPNLTPEQIQAKKKLPRIMYTVNKTKAEGIPEVKPRTTLLKKAEELRRVGYQIRYEDQMANDAILSQIEQLSKNDLQDLSSLRKMVNSKAGQEGDIETLYTKNAKLVDRVLNRMREITNDYEGNINRTDVELLDIALSLPSKSKATIPLPIELKQAKELEKQAKGMRDIVYNAEPKLKIQSPQQRAEADFKEWSRMVFKDTVSNEKQQVKSGIKSVGEIIEQQTQKGLQGKYVSNKKGNIVIDKAGRALDKDIMDRAELWKDKARPLLSRETIERNFEDIMGKDAPEMKERFIAPVKKAEADRIRWLNRERREISSLGIKARSVESKLLQRLGENKINRSDVVAKVGEVKTQQIERAINVIRGKYDTYLNDINRVLKQNGYDPIPKRKDYFTHFQEVTNLLEQVGIPVRDTALPTDVNGLTADFKPGKNFFANALQRKTDVTDFDAIQGIDKYIEGASKQIYHTDNIQNLRLLEKSIRAKFAGTQHLTNFVADLTEYINNLAGKKSMLDRSAEGFFGRKIYAFATGLQRKVGANMVAANVSSALTNYIPFTQSLATTDKPSFIKGMAQTISGMLKDDGFIDRSDFLTRRIGSDRISMNIWEKAGDKASWLFKAIDNFTAQTIVRSKFNEGIKKGLSPVQAMKRADDWAARMMADRSLGSTPTMFNSQTLRALTMFQLEVNNQLSFMAKDIPRNFSKIGAASAIGQLFLYSYIFNNIYEKITSRRPAFDPVGVAQQAYEDYINPNMKKGRATQNLVQNIGDQLPFSSTFTGGRIPIGAAIPDVPALIRGEANLGKEFTKPLTYLLPPFGGGQVKKSVEGVTSYNQGYTTSPSGRIRFVIPQNAGNRIKTTLFGPNSVQEAQKYFREGTNVLGEKQTQKVIDAQDKVSEYNTILQKRHDDRQLESVKEQVKNNNSVGSYKNFIVIPTSDGKTKTIDLNFQPKAPQLTGNTELDKKLVSKYKGQITSKANDILDLYEAGKMTADEAEKAIAKLKSMTSKYSGAKAKAVKKVSVKLLKAPKIKTIKIKAPKLAKVKKIKMPKIVLKKDNQKSIIRIKV